MTTAVYVYGIVPAGTEFSSEGTGVGDPSGEVRVVRGESVDALVSDVDPTKPLGRPDDLQAHARVLDSTARSITVLPLRFGAVLTDEEAVRQELLDPNAETFETALKQLEGHVEYLLSGRYVEEAILAEILEENPDARALRDQLRATPAELAQELQMALGELILNAIAIKRETDAARVVQALQDFGPLSARPTASDFEVFTIAVLAKAGEEAKLEQLGEDLAKGWQGRMQVSLQGPVAAYDFVVTPQAV